MVPVAAPGTSPPAAWKQNMLVLLLLYPVVFLFGLLVQTPLLTSRAGCRSGSRCSSATSPAFCAHLLVPWASNRFGWWLQPAGPHPRRIEIAGVALLVALYAAMVFVFWRYCQERPDQRIYRATSDSIRSGMRTGSHAAERKTSNFPRKHSRKSPDVRSVQLDVGPPDHLAPLFSFVGDELPEISRSEQRSPPRSASRVLILGSARAALISLLSLPMISAGVFWARRCQANRSPRIPELFHRWSGRLAAAPIASRSSRPVLAASLP